MYDLVIPIEKKRDPIIVEGGSPRHVVLHNAGPAGIKAKVWSEWRGKQNNSYGENSDKPNFEVELRPGNQIALSGAFIRVGIHEGDDNNEFAAIGARILD